MTQYTVQEKDTLSAIAQKLGVSVSDISGYRSGDPNVIYPGEVLNVGGSKLGGLSGTLPSETGGKELPTEQGGLASLQSLFKRITERYTRSSVGSAFGEGMEQLGVDPSHISGRSLSAMVDFIKEETTPSMASILEDTVKELDLARSKADTQIQSLISTKGLLEADDELLARLASPVSSYDFETLMSIKANMEADSLKPASSQTLDIDGQYVKFDFDDEGNIVRRTVLGSSGAGWSLGDDANEALIDYAASIIQSATEKQQSISDEYIFNEMKLDKDIIRGKFSDTVIKNAIKEARQRTRDPEGTTREKMYEEMLQKATEYKEQGHTKATARSMLDAALKANLKKKSGVTFSTLPTDFTNLINDVTNKVYGRFTF